MPQMSPLLWLFLYFMFTIIFLIFIIMIYFNFNYSPISKESELKKISINWLW